MTTTTTNLSTARQLAEAFGCSLPTVMLRAKKLGFKFKGRTVVEHDALLVELETVRPRARKVVVDKKSKRALADRIEAHLAEGRSLLVAAKDELVQLDKSASDLNAARLALSVKVDLLTAEQKLVDFPSGS